MQRFKRVQPAIKAAREVAGAHGAEMFLVPATWVDSLGDIVSGWQIRASRNTDGCTYYAVPPHGKVMQEFVDPETGEILSAGGR